MEINWNLASTNNYFTKHYGDYLTPDQASVYSPKTYTPESREAWLLYLVTTKHNKIATLSKLLDSNILKPEDSWVFYPNILFRVKKYLSLYVPDLKTSQDLCRLIFIGRRSYNNWKVMEKLLEMVPEKYKRNFFTACYNAELDWHIIDKDKNLVSSPLWNKEIYSVRKWLKEEKTKYQQELKTGELLLIPPSSRLKKIRVSKEVSNEPRFSNTKYHIRHVLNIISLQKDPLSMLEHFYGKQYYNTIQIYSNMQFWSRENRRPYQPTKGEIKLFAMLSVRLCKLAPHYFSPEEMVVPLRLLLLEPKVDLTYLEDKFLEFAVDVINSGLAVTEKVIQRFPQSRDANKEELLRIQGVKTYLTSRLRLVQMSSPETRLRGVFGGGK